MALLTPDGCLHRETQVVDLGRDRRPQNSLLLFSWSLRKGEGARLSVAPSAPLNEHRSERHRRPGE